MSRFKNLLKKVLKQYPRNVFWRFHGPGLCGKTLPDCVTAIHFVCKGNICRSAFAHFMAEKLFSDCTENRIVSSSSGIAVHQPEDPPQNALKIALDSFGISLGGHKSTPLTVEICEHQDILLVMEGWQLSAVRKKFPEFKDRFFLLAQFEKEGNLELTGYEKYNIPDPYGRDEEAFVNCFSRIEKCIIGLKTVVDCHRESV